MAVEMLHISLLNAVSTPQYDSVWGITNERSFKILFYFYAGPCMELRDIFGKRSLCVMFCYPPQQLIT